ncbi:hypothetical protein [Haloferula sp. BvORR071]|uniref:hypothetical protein n=1 Tax=Haloferula sp. BvORR071 TaxID=1396141 RepID=UPI00054DB910|nr:hypothetical protein [Haloferula sp. BvORR071]
MSPSDPFEDFLEDALGAPDFELGHEMRRRLLAAAVAGDTAAVTCDNVVPMDRADPDAAAGFAWLVGEAPASTALMSRMAADHTFLETLDSERCFLRTLRAALRRSAAAAVPAPARRSWVPAAAMSAAAVLALAAGAIFWSPGSQPATATAVAAAEPALDRASSAPDPGLFSAEKPALISSATPDSGDSGASAAGGAASLPEAELAGLKLPAHPEPQGTGRSVALDDPLLEAVQPLGSALAFAAKDEVLPEPMLAMLGGGLNDSGSGIGMDSSSEGMLASLSGNSMHSFTGGMGSIGGGGLPNGAALIGSTGPTGGKEGTIPEPGGALPVMIGFLILLLRRPARQG